MTEHRSEDRSSPVLRRRFLAAVSAAAAAPLGATYGSPSAAAGEPVPPGLFREPSQDLPLVEDADVIVCGAGPAGVTAATIEARAEVNRIVDALRKLGLADVNRAGRRQRAADSPSRTSRITPWPVGDDVVT